MIEIVKINITNMHCSSCAMNIDGNLEDAEGVKKASTSFARHQVEVEFDADKISLEKIKDIIRQTGYEVEG